MNDGMLDSPGETGYMDAGQNGRSMSLNEYSAWTRGLWQSFKDQIDDPRSFSLIGLGLAGETGECIEAMTAWDERLADDFEDESYLTMRKEFGDWIYYWARLANAIEVLPSAVVGDEIVTVASEDCLTQWLVNTSRLVERIKKHVRDGRPMVEAPNDPIFKHMADAYAAWWNMAAKIMHDGDPASIWNANVQKLEDRKARGVLHGSGNNR